MRLFYLLSSELRRPLDSISIRLNQFRRSIEGILERCERVIRVGGYLVIRIFVGVCAITDGLRIDRILCLYVYEFKRDIQPGCERRL